MHERQNAIVTNATKATKAARRRKEPRQRRTAAPVSPVSLIDYNKDPMPLETELWGPKP
jgi:hypothetical protein